ncbi:MAG TPA: EthD domain-containing protein [Solirubrobacteraceae bacterium]
MYKVYAYLSKRPDLSPEAFIDYYENHHVPLVLSFAPMPRVYKRNYLLRGHEGNREDPSIDFDVMTELVWEDRSGFDEWITKLGREEIATDEGQFLDRAKTRAYVVEEHVSAA